MFNSDRVASPPRPARHLRCAPSPRGGATARLESSDPPRTLDAYKALVVRQQAHSEDCLERLRQFMLSVGEARLAEVVRQFQDRYGLLPTSAKPAVTVFDRESATDVILGIFRAQPEHWFSSRELLELLGPLGEMPEYLGGIVLRDLRLGGHIEYSGRGPSARYRFSTRESTAFRAHGS